MLIEFRIANYRSIHEPQIFSLVASKDVKHPENLIPVEGYSLLKAAALYGANASGKSNLIKALMFMKEFVSNSATHMNEGDQISGVAPFRLTLESQQQPSLFEVTLIHEGVRYIYGFTTTRERVYEEWLEAFVPGKKRSVWFERRFEPLTETINWKFGGPLKKEGKLLQERTRDNALVLSTGARENVKSLQILFHWFSKYFWIFDLSEIPHFIQGFTTDLCYENENLKNVFLRWIHEADLGIDALIVADEPEPPSLFNLLNYKPRKIKTFHSRIDSESSEQFDFDSEESKGTQRFFTLVGPFISALIAGAVVVIDELDCSLHPLLVRKLIELFQSSQWNTKGAQLLFTTHDSSLLDPELFRRDQIWLAEKRQGASEFFSLYDFVTDKRPRNTEAFQRNYLAGRYGGVPQFGPVFEELEVK